MPKGTREHILEEESRKHFENLLPDHWVIRKPDPDYGIDAEVEIFDKDDSSRRTWVSPMLYDTHAVYLNDG